MSGEARELGFIPKLLMERITTGFRGGCCLFHLPLFHEKVRARSEGKANVEQNPG